MSKNEKSVDDQIIELVNQYQQITIKQIAERLDRDLGQISKRIKILEQKQFLKKIEYSATGSKSHSKMITFADGYIHQNSPVNVQNVQVPKKAQVDSQLDSVNLTDEDNLIGQLDISHKDVNLISQLDSVNLTPTMDDLDFENELDLSDIENDHEILEESKVFSKGNIKYEVLRAIWMLYSGAISKKEKGLEKNQLAKLVKEKLSNPANFAQFLKNVVKTLEVL